MTFPYELSVLNHVLTGAPDAPPFDGLEPLPPAGLDNDHVRLHGTGLVARVPRWPLDGLTPTDALALRAARFRRAAASGHTPALHAVLPPADGLPNGALLVDEIAGRTASVPGDMGAVADALAALHSLPVPRASERAPLPNVPNPAPVLIDLIDLQSEALADAGADGTVQRLVTAEIETARRHVARWTARPQPVCLVGTDTHPGNFVIAPQGRAILVDLDKALYGAPAVDLAHASLGTSVYWATGDWLALPDDARQRFEARYLAALPADLAAAILPWLAPMTRLTWLRTTTWAATWRVARLPGLRDLPGLKDLVAGADRRTAAMLTAENVARECAQLPPWDAEDPA